MIPEQAKLEIIRKHAMGETWTAIRNWLEEEYGVKVHRTTISRWHAKEVYSRPINDEEDIEILKSSVSRFMRGSNHASFTSPWSVRSSH